MRAYRRAVRALLHLQHNNGILAVERDREAAVAFGKARLAHLVAEEDFVACPATAAFTAYYVARLNMRTRFTSGSGRHPPAATKRYCSSVVRGRIAASECA
ncbi:hypothetical protein [Micromonospora palomenae]|uniref:hypothetical protein n=1 Tax=Micromonospora palomenae TaxID=1461247 RepID=UPI003F8883CC